MVAEVGEEAGTATVGSHQQRNSISTNHSTPTSQSTAASVTSTPPLPQRVDRPYIKCQQLTTAASESRGQVPTSIH
ncbi:hypothetical protein [Oryza sativa Japonica Group]|uniref:Uncharacterized protein P0581F09.5 n=1 Tax=Oryza sativa subsp. japonica TaxID=39947 RepID=Q942A9_ORYSJ|nr:hypothetical protein [Oryza sativa Japonica Group]